MSDEFEEAMRSAERHMAAADAIEAAAGVGSGAPNPAGDLGAINVVGRVLIAQGVDFSEYEGDRTALVPIGRTARAIVEALEAWRVENGVDHV